MGVLPRERGTRRLGLDLPSVTRPTSVRRDFHSNELIVGIRAIRRDGDRIARRNPDDSGFRPAGAEDVAVALDARHIARDFRAARHRYRDLARLRRAHRRHAVDPGQWGDAGAGRYDPVPQDQERLTIRPPKSPGRNSPALEIKAIGRTSLPSKIAAVTGPRIPPRCRD